MVTSAPVRPSVRVWIAMSLTLSRVSAPQAPLSCADSIVIAASPEALYGLVSDITRMGEWGPVTSSCWWDSGDGPAAAGAWFTGRNQAPGRDPFQTRCQVAAADPGKE